MFPLGLVHTTQQDSGWSPWLCAHALALRRSCRSNQCPPATWRQKERAWLKCFLGQSLNVPGVGLLKMKDVESRVTEQQLHWLIDTSPG